jgi:hypothetical protein
MNINKKDLQQLQEMYSKVSEHILDDLIDNNNFEDSEHNQCDDAISMAKTQLLNIMHNVQEMLEVIEDVEHFEPWMTGMLSNADCSISKLKEVVLFRD